MNSAPPDAPSLSPSAPAWIRAGLALAALLAAAATLQVLIWPRRPQAPPPPASLPGWNRLGERPGNTERTTSLSVSRRFGPAEPADPALQHLELTITTLAQTSDEGIEVAALTKGQPLLALRDRRLLRLGADDRPRRPGAVAAGGRSSRSRALRQVALGRIDGQSALQTCLTPRGYAVTASGTQNLLFTKATTFRQRWNYLLRSWPPQPHTCLLVTLRGPVPAATLVQAWPAVRAGVRVSSPSRS